MNYNHRSLLLQSDPRYSVSLQLKKIGVDMFAVGDTALVFLSDFSSFVQSVLPIEEAILMEE